MESFRVDQGAENQDALRMKTFTQQCSRLSCKCPSLLQALLPLPFSRDSASPGCFPVTIHCPGVDAPHELCESAPCVSKKMMASQAPAADPLRPA